MSKKKILIIDDEADLCKMVKKNLELSGKFEVAISENGNRGLVLASSFNPDLILLDIMMPNMNGFQVLEKLKSDSKTTGIPVMMLSAKEDDKSKVRAAQLCDEDYITKPITSLDLENKIEEILKRTGK